MAINKEQIAALLRNPSESLQVEIKTWLDPQDSEDAAKIVKAIFALRNRNGGFLVIGFNNETLEADEYTQQKVVSEVYHLDLIQGLVSRYANLPFEIEVAVRERERREHPVILVPEGLQVPVVVKRDLNGEGGKSLLKEGDLYFRTLRSNGTPSSARISPNDYPDLLDICFENREANIGRFIRRQLSGIDLASLGVVFSNLSQPPAPGFREKAFTALDGDYENYTLAIERRNAGDQYNRIENALTMHVAMLLEPQNPQALANQEFMNRVAAGNPQYSGWPVWLDTRYNNNADDRPYVHDGGWQTLMADLDGGWFSMFEYLRYDPRGAFFIRRVMQDDLTEKVQAGTALDATLMIFRVTEVIAAGINIAKATGWSEEHSASFAFRWTGLKDRRLTPWVNSFRSLGARGQSSTESVDAFVEVPIGTPHSALGPYVKTAVDPLFSVFDGYEPSVEAVETNVQKVVERKMDN
jgi:hypothetical protein